MPAETKIATCCYCGTRAALVLRGNTRHELSCAACGAPLHTLKGVPLDPRAHGASPRTGPVPDAHRKPRKTPRPAKRRKSLKRRLLGAAFDLIEDVFD